MTGLKIRPQKRQRGAVDYGLMSLSLLESGSNRENHKESKETCRKTFLLWTTPLEKSGFLHALESDERES